MEQVLTELTEHDLFHRALPNKFDLEDFSKCSKNTGEYCKLDIKLRPKLLNTTIWRYIESTQNSLTKYDRSVIYRSICIPKSQLSDMETYSENIITNELKDTIFSTDITNIQCLKKIPISSWDYFAGVFFGSLLLLTIVATFLDVCWRKNQNLKKTSKLNQYLLAFSITSNWRKLTGQKHSEDFTTLKCIQGVRIYNMTLTLALHSFVAWYESNISSLEVIETIMTNSTYRTIFIGAFFIIQTNFLISSWLLTNKINDIYTRKGYFSIKDGFYLIINRYIRLFPVLFVGVLLFKSSTIFNSILGPNNFEVLTTMFNTCRMHWFDTLMMKNNMHTFDKVGMRHEIGTQIMSGAPVFTVYLNKKTSLVVSGVTVKCHPVTWYLSNDSQLYVANVLFLYLNFKFRWNIKKALMVLFAASCLIFGSVIYVMNMNVLFQMGPEYIRLQAYFRGMQSYWQYISFYCNWGTSIVGVICGTVFYKLKNKEMELPWIFKNSFGVLLFWLLPCAAMRLSIMNLQSYPILAAVLGSMVKPMYSMGIGIGILQMIFSENGLMKQVCEWEPAVRLSNFVYATYIFHYLIEFTRFFTSSTLLNIQHLLAAIVFDIIVSYVVGGVLTVLVEQPGCNLQKILIPQIKYKDKVTNTNINEKSKTM